MEVGNTNACYTSTLPSKIIHRQVSWLTASILLASPSHSEHTDWFVTVAFQAFVADYSCGAASDFHRTSLPDSAIGKLPVSAIQFKLNIGSAAEIVKKNLTSAKLKAL